MSVKTIEVIQRRAELYRIIRDYFHHQGVLEVEVPLLGKSSALDSHLASMSLEVLGDSYYLQTSPELFMKRLLAMGSGSIFSICKSFREGEVSNRHNPEFTMLEWYRVGYSLEELIEDVSSLIQKVIPAANFEITTYANVFQERLGINPHISSDVELLTLVHEHSSYQDDLDRSACLDLLMSQIVEPSLRDRNIFVIDYPACQAAMAQIALDGMGNKVAKRFELYMQGVELANGYLELVDASEQSERFKTDMRIRQELNLPQIAEDEKFLQALKDGMPPCSGVALGLDRLLWVRDSVNTGDTKDIDLANYILFPWKSL